MGLAGLREGTGRPAAEHLPSYQLQGEVGAQGI